MKNKYLLLLGLFFLIPNVNAETTYPLQMNLSSIDSFTYEKIENYLNDESCTNNICTYNDLYRKMIFIHKDESRINFIFIKNDFPSTCEYSRNGDFYGCKYESEVQSTKTNLLCSATYDNTNGTITYSSCSGLQSSTQEYSYLQLMLSSNKIYFTGGYGYLVYSDISFKNPYFSISYNDEVIYQQNVLASGVNPIFGEQSITYYTIEFNIPSGSTLLVKDINNATVSPESGTTYKLPSGTYTYTVTKDLYNSKQDIEFTVIKDEVIEVKLTSLLNLSTFNNIFTSYYTYLSTLTKSIYAIDVPFFLVISSVSIVITLIFILIKIIRG